MTAIYADDTCIMTKHKDPRIAINTLQQHINTLESWFSQWNLKINTSKSVAMYFARGRRSFVNRVNLKLLGQDLPWASSTPYLGVTLDTTFTWKPHTELIRIKAKNRIKTLYPLLCRNSELSIDNKLLLYKSMIRSLISYAAPIWAVAAKTNFGRLETVQKILLREMTGAYWFYRNPQIRKNAKITTLKEYFVKLAKKFFANLNQVPNLYISNLPSYDATLRVNKKRPRAMLLG